MYEEKEVDRNKPIGRERDTFINIHTRSLQVQLKTTLFCVIVNKNVIYIHMLRACSQCMP